MPRYEYKAKRGPGKTTHGEVTAESVEGAVARIEAQGCSPVWVREKVAEGRERPRVFGTRASGREVTLFTRQLAVMLRSGVPILRALYTVRMQPGSWGMRRTLAALEEAVRDGRSLSEAMAAQGRLFPELYVSMVRSGESAGALDEVLFRLAEARERAEDLSRKVRAASAYPALMLVLGVATVVVMVTVFLPRITGLFEHSQRVLPLPTRLLMGISTFVSQHGKWIGLALLLMAALAGRVGRTERGGLWMHGLALRAPLFGAFWLESDLARFARTLALLTRTDIAMDRAVAISARVATNRVLRGELAAVGEAIVKHGRTLWQGLREARHLPLFLANMVSVGEESGDLEGVLLETAGFYERQLDYRARLVTSLLEPALILVIGAIVGFIVVAMILPIFEIGETLR